jgi:mycothiol synthase
LRSLLLTAAKQPMPNLRAAFGKICRMLVGLQERKIKQESVLLSRSLQNLPDPESPPYLEITTLDRHYSEEDLLNIHNEALAGTSGFKRAGSLQLEAFKASPHHDPKGVLIARIDGVAVGYCFARYIPDGPSKITGLAVLNNYRGMGIGRALLIRGLHYLRQRGADRVQLLVDLDDSIRSFYEQLGFEPEKNPPHPRW